MTTIPIHSVKHVKATYRRYQIMAVASVCVTVVAVLITALTGLRLNYLSKSQLASSSARNTQLSSKHEKESAALKAKLVDIEKQLATEKEAVQNLTAKSTELQKKLNEAKVALQNAISRISVQPPPSEPPVQQDGQSDASPAPQDQSPAPQDNKESAPSSQQPAEKPVPPSNESDASPESQSVQTQSPSNTAP